MPNVISSRVSDFIARCIESIGQLECLLLLRKFPEREWSPAEVALELRSSLSGAAIQLVQLHNCGLLAAIGNPAIRYMYRPAKTETREIIDELAGAYDTHRLAIINQIYDKPLENIRNFADAFRLKKNDKEDEP